MVSKHVVSIAEYTICSEQVVFLTKFSFNYYTCTLKWIKIVLFSILILCSNFSTRPLLISPQIWFQYRTLMNLVQNLRQF